MPGLVVIDGNFNAFAARVGWRRTLVVGLGAPLWVSASPQSRVALLAHELGHFAHGDLTHGWWVGGAKQSLFHWLDVASGMRNVTYGGLDIVQKYLFAPVRGILTAYLMLITWVSAPARQRQELLADIDALRAGGTEGAEALLELLLCEPTVSTAITRAAMHPSRPDVWQVVTEAVGEISDESRARQRAHAEARASRIDDSHPATTLRLTLVHSLPHRAPAVLLDSNRSADLDSELIGGLAQVGKDVTDRARAG